MPRRPSPERADMVGLGACFPVKRGVNGQDEERADQPALNARLNGLKLQRPPRDGPLVCPMKPASNCSVRAACVPREIHGIQAPRDRQKDAEHDSQESPLRLAQGGASEDVFENAEEADRKRLIHRHSVEAASCAPQKLSELLDYTIGEKLYARRKAFTQSVFFA